MLYTDFKGWNYKATKEKEKKTAFYIFEGRKEVMLTHFSFLLKKRDLQ